MNASTRARLAIAPALLAALALSACQDQAPTAAPPSPAAPTAAASTNAQPAPSSGAPAPTAQTAPSSDAAPAPSSSAAGARCETNDSSRVRRGSLAPKPLNTPQQVKRQSGAGEIEMTIGAPTVDTAGGDSFFPGDGMQTVIYPITIKVLTGTYVTSELGFGLTDETDMNCERDGLNTVVPKSSEVPIEIFKAGDSVSAKIGWAIPAGADLSKYTLTYADDRDSGQAEVAWVGK